MSSGIGDGAVRVQFVADLSALKSGIVEAKADVSTATGSMASDLGKVETKATRTAKAVGGLATATGQMATAEDRASQSRDRAAAAADRRLSAEQRMLAQAATTQRQIEAARAANDNLAGSINEVSRSLGISLPLFDRLGGMAGRLGPLAVGLTAVGAGVAVITASIVAAGDQYATYENQLKAAGVATGAVRGVTRDLAASAVSTRVPLDGLVALYARLTRVSGDLGISQAEVRRGTDILSKSIATSGLSAAEAASGVLQLSQALQSGRLQGDELRSLLENMPDIAKAIAREFKTTIGGLRQLGEEGALTSDRVFKAILNAGPEIEASFARTQPTIATATTAVTEAFKHLGAEMDRILNLSPTIAAIIQKVANAAEAAAQGVGGFEDRGRAGQIENLQARQRELEALLSSIAGSGDAARIAGVQAQIAGTAQAVDMLTRAAATFADQRIDEAVGKVEPPLRFMSDELVRLTNEASTASGQLPGLAGALNGVAGAAANAATQVASVAAGIRAIQGLNPDLAGVLGFIDKSKSVNDTFEATKKRIQTDFGDTGNSEEAARQLTQAMDERTRALKALNDERNKPVQAYVRSGELAQMSDLDKALAQNGDSYASLRKQVEENYRVLASKATDAGEAAKIKAQGEAEVAKLDTARKMLDAKTKADASAKAARSAGSSGPDTDAFDSALQRSRDQVEEMKLQAEATGKASEEVYRLTEANRLRRAAVSAGRDIDADLTRQIEEQADAYARQRKATEDALEGQRRMQEGVRSLGQDFSSFVDDVVMGGRTMGEAFAGLARTLGSSGLQALFTGQGPLAGLLGTAPTERGGIGGLFGGNFDLSKVFNTSAIEKAVGAGSETGILSGLRPLLEPAKNASGQSMGLISSPLGKGLSAAGMGAAMGYGMQSPVLGALGGGMAGRRAANDDTQEKAA